MSCCYHAYGAHLLPSTSLQERNAKVKHFLLFCLPFYCGPAVWVTGASCVSQVCDSSVQSTAKTKTGLGCALNSRGGGISHKLPIGFSFFKEQVYALKPGDGCRVEERPRPSHFPSLAHISTVQVKMVSVLLLSQRTGLSWHLFGPGALYVF